MKYFNLEILKRNFVSPRSYVIFYSILPYNTYEFDKNAIVKLSYVGDASKEVIFMYNHHSGHVVLAAYVKLS